MSLWLVNGKGRGYTYFSVCGARKRGQYFSMLYELKAIFFIRMAYVLIACEKKESTTGEHMATVKV